ncbi:MAG: hypothetical protein E6J75_10165, partial [Deltaproteobacteria bacterium]
MAGFAEASTAPTADFNVSVALPPGFGALGTGAYDGRGRWRATAVRDFALSVGRFRVATAIAHAPDRVDVTVGVAGGLADDPAAYVAKAVRVLEDFGRRFGPYPWPTYTVAVTPGLRGGIEYPAHAMQGPGTIGRTTSHELGHQWFYALVGNDQGRDPWLDEGLASWAEARFEEVLPSFVARPLAGGAGVGLARRPGPRRLRPPCLRGPQRLPHRPPGRPPRRPHPFVPGRTRPARRLRRAVVASRRTLLGGDPHVRPTERPGRVVPPHGATRHADARRLARDFRRRAVLRRRRPVPHRRGASGHRQPAPPRPSLPQEAHTALPQLGNEQQLQALMARLQSQMLDRSRPLWELWFVEGLQGERVAIIQKTHHALVDGVSSVDVATVILDLEQSPAPVEAPAWEPAPAPTPAELLRDSVVERMTVPREMVRSVRAAARGPRRVLERAAQLRRAFTTSAKIAPRTSLNVAVGPHRRYEMARVEL